MPTNSTRTEYQRERRRVLQAVRRAEKRGTVVDRSLIPDLKKHPTKRDINALKTIKPSTLLRSLPISEQRVTTDSANIIRNKSKNISATNKVTKPVQDINTNRIKTGGTNKTNTGTTKLSKVKAPKSPKVKVPKQKKEVMPKLPLTAEQKRDIRVKAGRKAWETRRSKMTDEQYEEYKKQFVQRMRQARGIQEKIESDLSGGEFDFVVPVDVVMDTSLIDYIRGKINEYVDKFYVVVQEVYDTYSYLPNWAIINEEYKNSFINAFETLVNNLGEQKAVQYLRENEYELVEALQHKWFGSSQAVGEVHYMTAMNILTQGNISTTTAEIINAVNESYDSDLWDYTMGME